MLNVGGAELLVIALVALIALGPEQLPSVMRKLGALSHQLRSLSSDLKEEFFSGLEEPSRPPGSTGAGGRRPFDPSKPVVPHGYAEQMAAERIRAQAGDPTPPAALGPTGDAPASVGDAAGNAASNGIAAGNGDGKGPTAAEPQP